MENTTEYKGYYILTIPKGNRDCETSLIFGDEEQQDFIGGTASDLDKLSSLEKAKIKIDNY